MGSSVASLQRLKIDNTDIFLEDFGPGQGKVTISDTFGHNYSYYWGAMGSQLSHFIYTIDSGYFARNLIGSKDHYVVDWKRTFAQIRKFIRTELDLPWYKHQTFQEHMREKLRSFQSDCEEADNIHLFVSMFDSGFIDRLDYNLIIDREERKALEKSFKDISEQWHFICKKEGPEYLWLTALHKKLKDKLTNPSGE